MRRRVETGLFPQPYAGYILRLLDSLDRADMYASHHLAIIDLAAHSLDCMAPYDAYAREISGTIDLMRRGEPCDD